MPSGHDHKHKFSGKPPIGIGGERRFELKETHLRGKENTPR